MYSCDFLFILGYDIDTTLIHHDGRLSRQLRSATPPHVPLRPAPAFHDAELVFPPVGHEAGTSFFGGAAIRDSRNEPCAIVGLFLGTCMHRNGGFSPPGER